MRSYEKGEAALDKQYFAYLDLLTCHCDMYGSWRPGSILETMQEAAGIHCAMLGAGLEKMDELGIAWVLSRAKVQMKRLPQIGEHISVETYPTPCRHLFYPRANVFRDAAGDEIGYANSLWVIVDKQTHKITQNLEIQEKIPDVSDLRSRVGLPATVRPLAGIKSCRTMLPQFTDFDTLHHVNNTKYLDYCCNALGHDVMKQYHVMSFDINYDSEILPDCEISTELVREEEQFTFCGYSDRGQHFAIAGVLGRRE